VAVDRNIVSYAAAAALAALVTYILIVGEPILLPFVIAVFVWYLINAVATWASRIQVRGRPLARPLRLGMGMLVLVSMGWLIVRLIVSNVGTVMATAPVYEQNLLRLANQAANAVGLDEVTDVRGLFARMDLTGLARNLTLGLTGVIGSLGTVAIYTVFLLLEQHYFARKIAALFPDARRQALVHQILRRIGKEIQTYVWLKTLISAGTAGASYLVMKVAGLDLAEFWAVLIFFLNYIPYIGSWLGVIFPALMALVQFHTMGPFFGITAGLAVTQFTGGSIVEPRLMGTGLNVSPVVMLLSLALWGNIWGVVGMFLAVPMTVVLMIIFSHVGATRPLAVLLSANGEVQHA